ncbi:hypothetical protein [Bradyrhizobium sp. USDA 4350]
MKSKIIKGYCGNPDAPFPSPLARYVTAHSDGYVSFCYAGETGALQATLWAINTRLATAAVHRRAKDRDAALKEAAAYTRQSAAEHDLIDMQWQAHLDAIDARRETEKRQFEERMKR